MVYLFGVFIVDANHLQMHTDRSWFHVHVVDRLHEIK